MIELNEQTRFILGRPNFTCAGIARVLRHMGHDIQKRAEDEQAAVIHWMLSLYEEHGDTWRDNASEILEAEKKKLEANSEQPQGDINE